MLARISRCVVFIALAASSFGARMKDNLAEVYMQSHADVWGNEAVLTSLADVIKVDTNTCLCCSKESDHIHWYETREFCKLGSLPSQLGSLGFGKRSPFHSKRVRDCAKLCQGQETFTHPKFALKSESLKFKVMTKEDSKESCPALLKTSFNIITNRWLAYYQGTMNSVSQLLTGALYQFAGSNFEKDDRLENLPACCSDKYTVAFYAAALHTSVRKYTTRNKTSVRVPTKMMKEDRLRIGNVDVPLRDIDEVATDGPLDFNCIMELLRGIEFNDWLNNKDHSNSWEDLVGPGKQFQSKKDWIMSWYLYYTQADGSPAMDPPKVDLRSNYFKADMWEDGLERAMAFDMIGSHRVELVKEAGLKHSPKWMVKLNEFASLKVRKGFGAYGADMYFNQEGMPVLIITPSGDEIDNGDKDWQYWKFVWRSSLVGVITLVDHLYASHFRAANVLARGVREALAPEHPLRRLLSIFTFGTIDVNTGAMHTLVGVNHALHRTTPFEDFDSLSTAIPTQLRDPVEMHKHFLNGDAWGKLPAMIQSTPYFKDGRVLFEAIKNLVHKYAHTILEPWCDQDGYLLDGTMKDFRNYLATLNNEGNFAGLTEDMNKCATMTDRLIATIWQVTGWHRHVGKVVEYIDPDLAAFSWKKGETSGRPLQYLIVSVIGATTAMAQPKINEDYTHIFAGMSKEQEAKALWRSFQEELKVVQKTVQNNNAERKVKNFDAYPSEVECSIAV